jgi:gliding motility-associated-like protein
MLKVELKYQKDKDCLTGPGSLDIDVSGGSGTYNYTWKGPSGFAASTQDISGLASGTYTLTVDDGHDCNISKSWDVATTCTSTCPLTSTATITNATACNLANGSVSVTISGGSGTYTYTWSDANYKILASTKNLTAKLPGSYVLFVQDQADSKCSKYFYYTINSNFKLTGSTSSNTACALPFTGSITTSVTGGSGNYAYEWIYPNGSKKTGTTSPKALTGGLYQLTLKDNTLGCTLQQNFTVATDATAVLNVASKVTATTACAPANGAIDVTVTKGSGNYLYTWLNQTTNLPAGSGEDIINGAAGTYSVLVSDTTSKCTAFQTIAIPDQVPAYPTVELSALDNANCSAPYSGAVKAVIKGSNGPFSYAWSNASGDFKSNLEELTALAEGDYTLKLTDNQTGCEAVATAMVHDQSAPGLSVTIDNTADERSCIAPDGQIQISINADGVPYTTSWSGPDNFKSAGEDLTGLQPGDYILTVSVMCNRAPVIQTDEIALDGKTSVQLNLLDFISDADNNLDPSTIEIMQKPSSGASAQIENGVLALNYSGISFRGTDKVQIKACDKLNACSQNMIAIEVDTRIVVYNAIAPNSPGDNKYMRINNLPAQNKVAIYNRWGDVVFEVDNYDNDQRRFSGTTNHGKELPSGTYFYKIELDNNSKPITGYLALKTE